MAELSDNEGEVQKDQHLGRLFPIDILPRVLLKASVILGVNTTPEKQSGVVTTAAKSRVIFPQGLPTLHVVPFPDQIQQVLDREWETTTPIPDILLGCIHK